MRPNPSLQPTAFGAGSNSNATRRLFQPCKEMQIAPFRMSTFCSIVMLGALTLASPSFAAGSKSAAADAEFRKMDTDKDGFLTKDELAAGHARMLKKSSY